MALTPYDYKALHSGPAVDLLTYLFPPPTEEDGP